MKQDCFLKLPASGWLLLFYVMTQVSSCVDPCPDEPVNIGTSSILIDFKDKNSQEYIVGEKLQFAPQDIKISALDNSNISYEFVKKNIPSTNKHYSQLQIHNLVSNQEDFNKGFCKTLFIDFKADRDTIEYCLTVNQERCYSEFGKIDLKYNHLMITEQRKTTFLHTQISK